MNSPSTSDLTTILWIIATLFGIAGLITLALVVWVVVRVRRINLPPEADFLDALRATPLIVVIVLDLLDFSLDIFSTPITWIVLSYLRLKPLRTVAVVKDLIPITNFVPLMTLSWLYARLKEHSQIASVQSVPQLPSSTETNPSSVRSIKRAK